MMNIRGIGMLKLTAVSRLLGAISLLAMIGGVPARGAPADAPQENSAARPSGAERDSVAAGKTDDSPEAVRKILRQKLIGMVADSALEIPPANMSPETQTREELLEEMDRAQKKTNNVAVIIRGSLELLTRFEPADDFSNRLWRTAAAIEYWQRSTASGNMGRLLDGIFDLCALLPKDDEANFRGALLRASLLSRRKNFAAADEILTELRDRSGLPKEFHVLVIVDLGDTAADRRDYDTAISHWKLLEDFTEYPVVVQPLLSAVFVHLERGEREEAYRVLKVLREMDPDVLKASPLAPQVNKLLELSRDRADSDAFWDGSAKWWPDWLAVDRKLGPPAADGEIVIPLIASLPQLGMVIGRAAQQNDAVERARGMRKLAHASRWEPSMLVELAELLVSLNPLQLSEVSREYRQFVISAYEYGNVKDPSLRRQLCCMVMSAYIEAQLNAKAQEAMHEFAALPAKDDNFSYIASRLAAVAALNTGKSLEEAIGASEKALDSNGYDNYRAQGVSLLAQLYERVGQQKDAISLLERESERPGIEKDAAGLRLLKTRLDALQHRSERTSHLSALTREWLGVVQLPWWDFSRPHSVSDQGIGDIDQAFTLGIGSLTPCEQTKLAGLVDLDDSQPEKRQLSASWIMGFYSCAFAPDSKTAGRWARSFLDSDQLPGGIREAFFSGSALRAFAEDDPALFENLAAHPVRKRINPQAEDVLEQAEGYFAALKAGDDACLQLGESLLRKPFTGASRDVFQHIVIRLSAHGEFEKAKRLIDALGAMAPAMDPENQKAVIQLAMLKVLSHDQKWRPANQAIRELVLSRFGQDSPGRVPAVPSSDYRMLALNLPAQEATRLRLRAIRIGYFTGQSDYFWVEFLRDLPRTAENLVLRSAALRAAIESAPDDETRAEAIRITTEVMDIDSPEERAIAAQLLAPQRKVNNLAKTADALRLFDFWVALRTGAPMDVRAALPMIKDDQTKRFANTVALSSALAAEDESLIRSLIESVSPQELLSDRMVPLSLPAYRALGMKDEAALAEQSAREAIYRLMMEFWMSGNDDAALKAYQLAELLGDQSLIPRSMAGRLIDSRRHELTKLTLDGEEAAYRRDWEKDARICEQALRDFPTYYHFYFLQGRALAALHRKEDALRSLRTYVSVVHDESEVREAKDLLRQLSRDTGDEEDGAK
jgi:tetratricopeptide (TPR) repeat protein